MPRRNRGPRTGRGSGSAARGPGAGSVDRGPGSADRRDGLGTVGWSRTEVATDGEWVVRTVPGSAGQKRYRCPGCDHEIVPGTSHLVTWPAAGTEVDTEAGSWADADSWADGGAGLPDAGSRPGAGSRAGAGRWDGTGAELRRHWHTPCWAARLRRRPGR